MQSGAAAAVLAVQLVRGSAEQQTSHGGVSTHTRQVQRDVRLWDVQNGSRYCVYSGHTPDRTWTNLQGYSYPGRYHIQVQVAMKSGWTQAIGSGHESC